MAELSKLLGFMSAWDRRDALMKYEALFDGADDEAELIATLGTPTKLAIGLALNYVPSPAPAARAAENTEPDGSVGEFAAGGRPESPVEEGGEAPAEELQAAESAAEEKSENVEELAPADELAPAVGEEAALEAVAEAAPEVIPEAAPEASPEAAPEAAPEVAPEAAPEVEEELPAAPKRKVRAFGLVGAILFGLVIGLPVALVLIIIGVPFILMGVGVIGGSVLCALSVMGLLAMFSDVLMIVGGGLLLCALGLLLTWFGLWLSFELGCLWIGGVVLRLGRALTYEKEVAAE